MQGQPIPPSVLVGDRVIRFEREIAAPRARVFAAFADPTQAARWWGPAGFSTTTVSADIRSGGHWQFTMHGPDGAQYRNESVFGEIQPAARIVIEHAIPHWFRLTVTLTPSGHGTQLLWEQEFESPGVAAQFRAVCEPANEQNLDRLQAHLAGQHG